MISSSFELPGVLEKVKAATFAECEEIFNSVIQPDDNITDRNLLENCRGAVAKHFAEQQAELFAQALQPVQRAQYQGLIGKMHESLESLALLDKDDLSMNIIAEEFVDSIRDSANMQMALFAMRFEHVVHQELELDDIPLTSSVIASHVRNAISGLDVATDIKIDWYRMILSFIAGEYEELLTAMNNLFIDHGVLVDLNEGDGRAHFKRSHEKIAKEQKRSSLMASISHEVEVDENGNAVAPDMMKVLAELDVPITLDEHFLDSDFNGQLIQGEALVKHFDIVKVPELDDGQYHEQNHGVTLAEQLKKKTELHTFSIDRRDINTIGMVSMLFEDISKSDVFAMPIKALLEQLQVPVLKTAILEKNFFVDGSNPAQTLLDKIAEQGALWAPETDPSRDFLYIKTSELIKKLSDEFDNTYDVFIRAIMEFDSYVKKHNQRMQRIEERTVSMLKANVRQNRAHKEAERHVNTIFKAFKLAPEMREFVDEYWKGVLFFVHNKYDSSKNAAWRTAVETELQLVRVLNGMPDIDKKAMIYDVRDQLVESGQPAPTANREIKKIVPFVRKTEKLDKDELEKITAAEKQQQELENQQQKDNSLAMAKMMTPAVPVTDIKKQQRLEEKTMTDEGFSAEFASLTSSSDDELAGEDSQYSLEELVQQFHNKLSVGTWLHDLRQGEPPAKLKVAAYIKYSDNFVLVNRDGSKNGEYNGIEMYELVQTGQLQLIGNTMTFDRSLEAVIGNLRVE